MTLTRFSHAQQRTSGHMFCGWGGDTEGFREAGWRIGWGANHSRRNVETWSANFGDAEALCQDMDRYDMRNLPPAQVLFASPVCTEISPASGRARKQQKRLTRGQLALLEHGPVATETWERTRATAYDILRATEVWGYDAVAWENVPEFATDWPLFDWWIKAFDIIGYNHVGASVCAAHISGPGNDAAPQYRDRIVGVFVRKGIPLPDLTPRPVGRCIGCGEDVEAVQSWRNPRGPRWGAYGEQFDYASPHIRCRNPVVKPYVRPVLEVIDRSDLGPKMSARRQGYAAATVARVERGIAEHGTVGTLVSPYYRTGVAKPVTQPLDTLTTRDRFWLLTLASRWRDCNYRRLTPREQGGAQRFPAGYRSTGNLGEQTAGIGNAVPVNVGRWMAERLAAALDGGPR